MIKIIQCPCGSGLPAVSCHAGNLVAGTQIMEPFKWNVRTELDDDSQKRVARHVNGLPLGVTVLAGSPMLVKQTRALYPSEVNLINTMPLTSPGIGALETPVPNDYFWGEMATSTSPTSSVHLLNKDDLAELVSGFAKMLDPVPDAEKRNENIRLVAKRFCHEFPNGCLDYMAKSYGAIQRLAFYHSLSHWTLFDQIQVESNLKLSSSSPLMNMLAQTSSVPFEILIKQRMPRGFIIDFLDCVFVFWLGESLQAESNPLEKTAILSPWHGDTESFDLALSGPLYRQLFAWLVGATNDIYRFLLNGARFESLDDPALEWFFDYLTYVEIVNLVHGIMNTRSAFVRQQLFMRLAYNIVSRQRATGGHIFDLPFSPNSGEIKDAIFHSTMPGSLAHHMWTRWNDLASRIERQFIAHVLPAFAPEALNGNPRFDNLNRTKYISHFVEALRHSTHGYTTTDRSDKRILFTHSGELPNDLPYLAFFWWLKIMIHPHWLFTSHV